MKDKIYLRNTIVTTMYMDISSGLKYTQKDRCTIGMLRYNNNSLKTFNSLSNTPYWSMDICKSIGTRCGTLCDSDSSIKAFVNWWGSLFFSKYSRIYAG